MGTILARFHDKTWFRDRIESLGDRDVVSSCSV